MEEETEPAAINDAMPFIDVFEDWNEEKHPRRSNGQFGNGSTSPNKNANITSSARGINKFANHGFINKNKELAHKKHLSEFPDMTMQDYINRGIELLQSPVGGDILGHKDKNQIITRYNKRTNEFAKGRPDRGIYMTV